MNGYFGGQKLTLDSKGRFTMPVRFRERLQAHCGGKVVLCKRPGRGVLVLPEPEFEPLVAQFEGMHIKHSDWSALLLGTADFTEVDGASRVMISPLLRDWLGISDAAREVELRGVGKYFELWESRTIEARDLQLDFADMPDSLSGPARS